LGDTLSAAGYALLILSKAEKPQLALNNIDIELVIPHRSRKRLRLFLGYFFRSPAGNIVVFKLLEDSCLISLFPLCLPDAF
jgi:hypothetical protein